MTTCRKDTIKSFSSQAITLVVTLLISTERSGLKVYFVNHLLVGENLFAWQYKIWIVCRTQKVKPPQCTPFTE